MKKALILVILLGVCVGGYIYYDSNRPVETAADKSSDYVISASALMLEFEEDEISANKKYNNTTIEVSGVVSDIQINGENVDVSFELDDDFSNLNIQLIPEMQTDLSLEVGKLARLKAEFVGVNTDLGIDIELNQGIILN